ncbi:uncharacterized protein DS421_9g257960 [Arachis hypogaea]|nr:uncharacterized protein DS421_9g257960 [Arachis hypogaea]
MPQPSAKTKEKKRRKGKKTERGKKGEKGGSGNREEGERRGEESRGWRGRRKGRRCPARTTIVTHYYCLVATAAPCCRNQSHHRRLLKAFASPPEPLPSSLPLDEGERKRCDVHSSSLPCFISAAAMDAVVGFLELLFCHRRCCSRASIAGKRRRCRRRTTVEAATALLPPPLEVATGAAAGTLVFLVGRLVVFLVVQAETFAK